MPEYKKKKVKKTKKAIKNTYTEEIKMSPKRERINSVNEKAQKENNPNSKESAPAQKKPRVIRGKKLVNKGKRHFAFGAIAVLIIAVVIFSLSLPTGLFEFIQNSIASVGASGEFPCEISGGTLINTTKMGKTFIAVTPTQASSFNTKSGKNVFTHQHGYVRPVVATSESRFLIYSQGEKEYTLYNLKKKIAGGQTKNDILTACVARNGTFAIATQSDGYSSEVTFYSKKGKAEFTWLCADYIINDIVLSDNGKRIVISAINANKGKFVSKLIVVEYDSPTPVYSKVYENDILLDIEANNRTFYAVFENKVEFFKWSNYSSTLHDTEKNFTFNRNNNRFTFLLAGHESNKGSNTAYIFNKKGEKVSEFNLDFEIKDVAFTENYIYILSDKVIYLYSIDGEMSSKTSCGFGVVRIIPVSHHSVITLTDNTADKIHLE